MQTLIVVLESRSAPTASNLTTSGEAQKVADEAEEDFEDAEPLLESFTQLSIYKPSTCKLIRKVNGQIS